MAKIVEDVVVIKFSKIVRDTDTADSVAGEEVLAALEQVAAELAGAGVVVEVERA